MSDRTHARIPSIGRDTFKVAVDLRATQPDRNGFQSYRFRSYKNAHQWRDQTYDPNPKKLDNTKSGYISGPEMATYKVAVDLRATQPDQNGFQSYRFGSYGNAYQWHDRTRTPAKVSVQQMVASFSVYQVLTSPVKDLKRLRQPTIVPST